MAFPDHNHLQLGIQSQKDVRNFYEIDGQMSQQPQMNYFNTFQLRPNSNSSYATTFGMAPGSVPDENTPSAIDLDWNIAGLSNRTAEEDFKVIKPKEERDLFFTNNNNSNLSSFDFLQPRSVSTGLGLSLDNTNYHCNQNYPSLQNNSPALFSIVGDEICREFHRQDAEIEKYLKTQGEKLRVAVLEKVHVSQIQTISLCEERLFQKLRAKEAEIDTITRKNVELEDRMEKLAGEVNEWQERARASERMISTLKLNLQQVYMQNKESKEGCGDSEVEDTASCCNDRAFDFRLLGKNIGEETTCKVCRIREVSMLLLPCRHLCLCKDCENMLNYCPLCHSLKIMGFKAPQPLMRDLPRGQKSCNNAD